MSSLKDVLFQKLSKFSDLKIEENFSHDFREFSDFIEKKYNFSLSPDFFEFYSVVLTKELSTFFEYRLEEFLDTQNFLGEVSFVFGVHVSNFRPNPENLEGNDYLCYVLDNQNRVFLVSLFDFQEYYKNPSLGFLVYKSYKNIEDFVSEDKSWYCSLEEFSDISWDKPRRIYLLEKDGKKTLSFVKDSNSEKNSHNLEFQDTQAEGTLSQSSFSESDFGEFFVDASLEREGKLNEVKDSGFLEKEKLYKDVLGDESSGFLKKDKEETSFKDEKVSNSFEKENREEGDNILKKSEDSEEEFKPSQIDSDSHYTPDLIEDDFYQSSEKQDVSSFGQHPIEEKDLKKEAIIPIVDDLKGLEYPLKENKDIDPTDILYEKVLKDVPVRDFRSFEKNLEDNEGIEHKNLLLHKDGTKEADTSYKNTEEDVKTSKEVDLVLEEDSSGIQIEEPHSYQQEKKKSFFDFEDPDLLESEEDKNFEKSDKKDGLSGKSFLDNYRDSEFEEDEKTETSSIERRFEDLNSKETKSEGFNDLYDFHDVSSKKREFSKSGARVIIGGTLDDEDTLHKPSDILHVEDDFDSVKNTQDDIEDSENMPLGELSDDRLEFLAETLGGDFKDFVSSENKEKEDKNNGIKENEKNLIEKTKNINTFPSKQNQDILDLKAENKDKDIDGFKEDSKNVFPVLPEDENFSLRSSDKDNNENKNTQQSNSILENSVEKSSSEVSSQNQNKKSIKSSFFKKACGFIKNIFILSEEEEARLKLKKREFQKDLKQDSLTQENIQNSDNIREDVRNQDSKNVPRLNISSERDPSGVFVSRVGYPEFRDDDTLLSRNVFEKSSYDKSENLNPFLNDKHKTVVLDEVCVSDKFLTEDAESLLEEPSFSKILEVKPKDSLSFEKEESLGESSEILMQAAQGVLARKKRRDQTGLSTESLPFVFSSSDLRHNETLESSKRRQKSEYSVYALCKIYPSHIIAPAPTSEYLVRTSDQIFHRCLALMSVISWAGGFSLHEEAKSFGVSNVSYKRCFGQDREYWISPLEREFLKSPIPSSLEAKDIGQVAIEELSMFLRLLGFLPHFPLLDKITNSDQIFMIAFERLVLENNVMRMVIDESSLFDLVDFYRRLYWVCESFPEKTKKFVSLRLLGSRRKSLEWMITKPDYPFVKWDDVSLKVPVI